MTKQKIENQENQAAGREFFEIVNWKKCQPTMKKGGQAWMKLYTSLLYHDGFAGMSSTQQMTIVALWLYAAVSGHHILPADPKWLFQRIPLLKEPPDLKPLAEAVDTFGNHNPFIRFCEAPKPKKNRSKKTDTEREREKDLRENKETNPTGSREKDRKNKERVAAPKKESRQQKEHTEENPTNPKESEAGQARLVHIPRPTRPVLKRGPQQIGSIIGDRFPDHWRDPDAQEFGWSIVEALGYERNEANMEIRSEWGSFAAWWVNIKSRASPMVLGEIREKAVEKARFLNSPKAKSARNKSAVWFKIMAGELSRIGIQIAKVKSV